MQIGSARMVDESAPIPALGCIDGCLEEQTLFVSHVLSDAESIPHPIGRAVHISNNPDIFTDECAVGNGISGHSSPALCSIFF
jgi:hypothetical protein